MSSDITAIVSGIRGVAIFPRVLFNSALDANLYFKDAAGNYQSWSGAAGYTPSLKIRQPKGFNAAATINYNFGALTISDGVNTRPITSSTVFGNTGVADPTTVSGFLGGFNGAVVGNAWVFNGGSGGAGVSAAALWAATRCTSRGTLGSTAPNGSIIFEADTVGNQANITVAGNTLYPAVDVTINVLRQGSASLREMILFHISPVASAIVSSFAQITNGWSCTIPFTDPSFVSISNTANVTVSEYQDFDCEITITRNSDSVIMAVVTAKIRVYRKQVDPTI